MLSDHGTTTLGAFGHERLGAVVDTMAGREPLPVASAGTIAAADLVRTDIADGADERSQHAAQFAGQAALAAQALAGRPLRG